MRAVAYTYTQVRCARLHKIISIEINLGNWASPSGDLTLVKNFHEMVFAKVLPRALMSILNLALRT